jgi:restriction system protein
MDRPDGTRAGVALTLLAKGVTLTDFEAGQYEGGARRFDKIVRFATVDCVKAGWLLKTKGTWSITDDGKLAYSKFSDPEAFHREARRLYGQWKRGQKPQNGACAVEPEEATGAEQATITFEEDQEMLASTSPLVDLRKTRRHSHDSKRAAK